MSSERVIDEMRGEIFKIFACARFQVYLFGSQPFETCLHLRSTLQKNNTTYLPHYKIQTETLSTIAYEVLQLMFVLTIISSF